MTIKTIGLDGDDTLWHNEFYFREAEREFVVLLSCYADDAVIEEHLFQTIKHNLALYGYGIKAFVLSMIEAALELGKQSISTQLLNNIVELGRSMMEKPVCLVDGVLPLLDELKENYRLILISKGDPVEQERKIAKSGLEPFFAALEIVSHKDKTAYEKLFKRHTILPQEMVMVGNSLKSDIVPVLEAGGWAVYIPYQITWALERADEPYDYRRYLKIDKLSDLPQLLHHISPMS
ncbi:HAD family hydrolase [uncultured Bartonella sp.]|uniref:HAD family hydrolase n=1 Tax=uncultured Bartonella sp. TaxID=104108 RepID=UPI0026102403|nr:HAD family hydrolase [uncultured Bartonella sp.]